MLIVRERKSFLAAASLAIIGLLGFSSSQAAPLVFDFTSSFSEVNPGAFGNSMTFSDTTAAKQVVVTSWSTAGGTTLSAANGQQLAGGAGLGVCNTVEGLGCQSTWINQSIDNTVGVDWTLLIFSHVMDLNSFVISPDMEPGKPNKKQDVDVTFFTGFINTAADANLAGKDYAYLTSTLGFTEYTNLTNNTKVPVTVDVTGLAGGGPLWANAILIGANRNQTDDHFTLTSITTVVPVPAAVWLFLSALGMLAGMRKVSR